MSYTNTCFFFNNKNKILYYIEYYYVLESILCRRPIFPTTRNMSIRALPTHNLSQRPAKHQINAAILMARRNIPFFCGAASDEVLSSGHPPNMKLLTSHKARCSPLAAQVITFTREYQGRRGEGGGGGCWSHSGHSRVPPLSTRQHD